MPHDRNTKKRIAVIGGGISGLAAVLELERLSQRFDVVLLESSPRLGGVLHSEQWNGFTVEHSADMFTTEPPTTLALVKRLGREDQLLKTIPTENRAYVATERGIEPLPSGLSLMLPGDIPAVLASRILTDAGKERFLEEENIPVSQPREDESLESFAVRRFGLEFFERLIQPLAGGIYTADPKQLSMRATMKRFLDLEQEHGSLIGAAKAQAIQQRGPSATSGARYGLFRAPEKGIGSLVDWMTEAIQTADCRTNQNVVAIERTHSAWQIKTRGDRFEVDGILLSTPAAISGQLLSTVDPELSKTLSTITTASSAIVVQAFDQHQFKWKDDHHEDPFGGYGIIIPNSLGRAVIACSISSNKFPGRAPSGKVLVRSFVGGALHGSRVDLPDDKLSQLAVNELRRTLQLQGDPEWTKVFRWRNRMPQYTMGHLDRVAQIMDSTAALAGIELAGNSYHGVGIPACIESGTDAAGRLASYLDAATSPAT